MTDAATDSRQTTESVLCLGSRSIHGCEGLQSCEESQAIFNDKLAHEVMHFYIMDYTSATQIQHRSHAATKHGAELSSLSSQSVCHVHTPSLS